MIAVALSICLTDRIIAFTCLNSCGISYFVFEVLYLTYYIKARCTFFYEYAVSNLSN